MSTSITRHNLELANEAFKSERIASLEKQLSAAQAALCASTELLRAYWDVCRIPAFTSQINVNNQITANERVLGGQP